MQNQVKEFDCCICLYVSQDPQVTPCGHMYCKNCIEEWLGQSNNCALCKEELSIEQLSELPRILANLYETLTVPCPFAENGCSDVLKLCEVRSHELTCRCNPSTEWECDDCESKLNAANAKEHDCIGVLKENLAECRNFIQTFVNLANDLVKTLDMPENNSANDVSVSDDETGTTNAKLNYKLFSLREDIELFVTMKNSHIDELNLQLEDLKRNLKSTEDSAEQEDDSFLCAASIFDDDIETNHVGIHTSQNGVFATMSEMMEPNPARRINEYETTVSIQELQQQIDTLVAEVNELMMKHAVIVSEVAPMKKMFTEKETEIGKMRKQIQEQTETIATLEGLLQDVLD